MSEPTSPFPDVRWGREDSRLRAAANAIGSSRPGSWLIRTLTPLDRRLLTRTDGRYTLLGPIGAPTLLLTTTGAKSGLSRVSPLLYVRDGDQVLVIGSNFGQAHHPAWTANLRANPDATVSIGGRQIPVRARELHDDERAAAIRRFVQLTPAYAAYQSRTDRDLRVFALTARPIHP
jgi:deazaflavin-dependent oxidoreductase (nitroreductase family)